LIFVKRPIQRISNYHVLFRNAIKIRYIWYVLVFSYHCAIVDVQRMLELCKYYIILSTTRITIPRPIVIIRLPAAENFKPSICCETLQSRDRGGRGVCALGLCTLLYSNSYTQIILTLIFPSRSHLYITA
jgi:hypothetical protein